MDILASTSAFGGVKIQRGIMHLEELQTLCGEVDNLRKLFVARLERECGKYLYNAIEKMKHLRYLKKIRFFGFDSIVE